MLFELCGQLTLWLCACFTEPASGQHAAGWGPPAAQPHPYTAGAASTAGSGTAETHTATRIHL
jgi:hypothetical protein